jgi:c-di-GMP-related signal transduction protein
VQKFVARQPIFDSQENIFGYELLFRSGLENYFKCDNPDMATSTVIADSFLLFGIETLTGGRNAFLNFTNDLILKKYATILPQQQVVIEILENISPSPELVSACRKLKDKGYRLALDDFEYRPDYDPLIDLADLIKIDIRKTPIPELKGLKKQLNGKNIPLLAEKVETREEFRAAREFGFDYFQGYFFGQPETFATKEIPGCKLNYLLLVKEINAEKPNLVKIEDIVKREPMICYKLFRYLNSPIFAFNREIQSIRHAMVMLGLDEVRKWISIVSLAAMGADKPSALIVALITRAKFCEKIAPHIEKQGRSLDLFMMGLLSMINTVLDNSLDQVLKNVAASEDVKTALLEGDGPLKPVLDLLVAAEKGQWKDISRIASVMGVPEETAIETYLDAIKWGNEILQMEQEAKEQKITI